MNAPRNAALRILGIAALAASLAGGGPAPWDLPLPRALADLSPPLPVFSSPLLIDNALLPIAPGGVKIFVGRESRHRITVVETHLRETRTFAWNGRDVACRVLREMKFREGAAREISRGFYAQSDDGAVYCFGQVEEPVPPPEDADDEPGDTESSSWVVGLVGPEDPPDTVSAADPSVAMPASVSPGDVWKPEDIAGVVDESDEAVRDGLRFRGPVGLLRDCVEVVESSALEPGLDVKWYAPGIGPVRSRGHGEVLRLQASTYRPR
jgi:hypothetical protein